MTPVVRVYSRECPYLLYYIILYRMLVKGEYVNQSPVEILLGWQKLHNGRTEIVVDRFWNKAAGEIEMVRTCIGIVHLD